MAMVMTLVKGQLEKREDGREVLLLIEADLDAVVTRPPEMLMRLCTILRPPLSRCR